MKRIRVFFVMGIVASLLSSLRMPGLPELEVIIFLIVLFSTRRFGDAAAATLIIMFCTHFYAIPDADFRFDSGAYPSIYTRSYGPIKVLDIMTILLSVISIGNIANLKRILFNKQFPVALLLIIPIGLLTMPVELQSGNMALFSARSILLVVSAFLLFSRLADRSIRDLSMLAVVCWTSKMFFAILFPATNPLYREIFGYQWNIYFAGDEYLTLGIYAAIILLMRRTVNPDVSHKKNLYLLMFAGLALALVAQRKGAIPYFGLVLLVVYVESTSSRVLKEVTKVAILVLPWSTFIFLLIVNPLLPELVQLAFVEQGNLLTSAISSIFNIASNDVFHFVFGVGPYGLYHVIGLDPFFDHGTSFGAEVGLEYRYAIWSLPYGRLLLNVGALGFVVYVWYAFKMFRSDPARYYLYMTVTSIFFFDNITPPVTVAYALGFVALTRTSLKGASRRPQLARSDLT